ncbi:MAG: MTH938/NDUFAF3 family protein [Candidatus Omnitrophota bacterium]
MHIDDYSFGSMTVDGNTYTSDLIVFPDKIKSSWWRVEGHSLCMEDLDEVLEYGPEVLVIGKGASGCMDVPEPTKETLEEKNIEVIEGNTGEVYRVFNDQIKKGRRAVGAFHLTC